VFGTAQVELRSGRVYAPALSDTLGVSTMASCVALALPGPAGSTQANPSRIPSSDDSGRTRAATVNVLVSSPPFAVLACLSAMTSRAGGGGAAFTAASIFAASDRAISANRIACSAEAGAAAGALAGARPAAAPKPPELRGGGGMLLWNRGGWPALQQGVIKIFRGDQVGMSADFGHEADEPGGYSLTRARGAGNEADERGAVRTCIHEKRVV